jgi:hypothetical protein
MPPGLRGRCCRSPAHHSRDDKGRSRQVPLCEDRAWNHALQLPAGHGCCSGDGSPCHGPEAGRSRARAGLQGTSGGQRTSAHRCVGAPVALRRAIVGRLLGRPNCSGIAAYKHDSAELGHFDIDLEGSMRVRFWGTRGSLPTPGPTTVRYGGNTSCLEVTSSSNALIIIDCGTGIRLLGQDLLARQRTPLRGHILISHTHWDHIQGIPFFAPFFTQGNEWDLYAPKGVHRSLRDTLEGQMQYSYFPVQLDDLGARIRYHELVEGTFEIADVTIRTHYLNHPALTFGYRLECEGATIVYASDHEPHARDLANGSGDIAGEDLQHCKFLSGADLVIHDAQFTAEEYPQKIGWGTAQWSTR